MVAYIVLYGWPMLVFLMYQRMPVQRAFIWSILLGYLFLPPASVAFNLPLLPEITKIEVAALSSVIMAVAFHGVRILRFPKSPLMILVIVAYVGAPILTFLTNTDPVVYGLITLPGLQLINLPSIILDKIFYLIPFIMAYSLLKDSKYLTDLLIAIVIGLMAYSVLILFEVRFSPQLNIWIYGYFQHSFDQMIRGGGFRPIVFLYHPLWVGFFTVMGVVAATALFRNAQHKASTPFLLQPSKVFNVFFKNTPRTSYLMLALYFIVVLVLSKSTGPILFGVTLFSILMMVKPKYQVMAATTLAFIVMSYPMLRYFGLIPVDLLVGTAGSASSDRAASLGFRLVNEGILLDRAMEKPWFGWGQGARHLVLDPLSGALLAIPDGQWIIIFGVNGIVGYFGTMGLILLPVFAALRWRNITSPEILTPYAPAFALLLAANAVDMLPNATLTPLTLVFAGALWRHLEDVRERMRTVEKPHIEPMFGGVVLPHTPGRNGNRTII